MGARGFGRQFNMGIGRRWLPAAAAALTVLAVALLVVERASAQQQPNGPTLSVGKESRDGATIAVPITVRDAQDLGGFQFVLAFDGNILTATGMNKGDFLGSSGREVLCPDPVIETNAIRVSCVTLGQEPAKGADGAGVLATLTFRKGGHGSTALKINSVKLVHPNANEIIPAAIENGVYSDPGSGVLHAWWFWLVIGVAVVTVVAAGAGRVLLARRRAVHSTVDV
jgi:hypothetical protein